MDQWSTVGSISPPPNPPSCPPSTPPPVVVPDSKVQVADITGEAREWRTASGRALMAVREEPAAGAGAAGGGGGRAGSGGGPGGEAGRLVLRSDDGRSEANVVEAGREYAGNVMHVISEVLLAHEVGGGGGGGGEEENA